MAWPTNGHRPPADEPEPGTYLECTAVAADTAAASAAMTLGLRLDDGGSDRQRATRRGQICLERRTSNNAADNLPLLGCGWSGTRDGRRNAAPHHLQRDCNRVDLTARLCRDDMVRHPPGSQSKIPSSLCGVDPMRVVGGNRAGACVVGQDRARVSAIGPVISRGCCRQVCDSTSWSLKGQIKGGAPRCVHFYVPYSHESLAR